jgi:hypothetical protein
MDSTFREFAVGWVVAFLLNVAHCWRGWLLSSPWDSWCGRRNSSAFVFSVRYVLKLKKQLSLVHIIQCSTTRWQHSDGRQLLPRSKNNKIVIDNKCRGVEREYGGLSYDVTWLVRSSYTDMFLTTVVIDLWNREHVFWTRCFLLAELSSLGKAKSLCTPWKPRPWMKVNGLLHAHGALPLGKEL